MILYFMLINKDIIVRLVFSFVFIAISLRVLGPVLFTFLKKKIPGQYSQDTDIDSMIRRQKERLRAQYGLTGDVHSSQNSERPEENRNTPPSSKVVQKLYQETHWGGGHFVKDIQQEIGKTYSYTMTDSKVNAFVLLCEKRQYINFLSNDHRAENVAVKNYLIALLLLFLLIDELREKKFFILEKIAKKLGISPMEFAVALQIKLLMIVSQKKELKEERIFTETLVINQYSE
ncbi:MAG: hypothetical protein ACXVCE_15335, partial [Bacteriovorax sp.]